jgi:hypothetical protein
MARSRTARYINEKKSIIGLEILVKIKKEIGDDGGK